MGRGTRWNVAEAKARLSEVLRQARQSPQVIESRGEEVAVVLGADAYRELEALKKEAAPAARMARLLDVSRAIREEGGAELVPPDRRPRRSPFAPRGRR